MYRYLLFSYSTNDALGGMEDCICKFNTLEEVKEQNNRGYLYFGCDIQLYDCKTGNYIYIEEDILLELEKIINKGDI